MIVDTSALIAILRRESGWEDLSERLLAAGEVRVSAGTLLEARIVSLRDGGVEELESLLDLVGAEIVGFDAQQAELAFEGFRRYGRGRDRAGLNFGDLFGYALARSLDAPLLYVGGDFSHTDVARG